MKNARRKITETFFIAFISVIYGKSCCREILHFPQLKEYILEFINGPCWDFVCYFEHFMHFQETLRKRNWQILNKFWASVTATCVLNTKFFFCKKLLLGQMSHVEKVWFTCFPSGVKRPDLPVQKIYLSNSYFKLPEERSEKHFLLHSFPLFTAKVAGSIHFRYLRQKLLQGNLASSTTKRRHSEVSSRSAVKLAKIFEQYSKTNLVCCKTFATVLNEKIEDMQY